jgi:hypothetical protein
VGLLKSHAKSAKDAKELERTDAKAAKDTKELERTDAKAAKDTKELERTDAKDAKDIKGVLLHTQHCGRSVKSLHYSFSPKKVR